MEFVIKKPDPAGEGEALYYDLLLDIVDQLQGIDNEMTLSRLKTYLLVMRYPELNTQELAERAAMPKSSMSRNLSALGSWNSSTKKGGYGLVEGRDFRPDRRIKFHTLTEPGRKTRDALVSIITTHMTNLSKSGQKP